MSIKKIKLYANISLVLLVAVIVIGFLFSNREVIEVKFLGWQLWTSPLYTLIFVSANMGIVTFLVSKRIIIIIKQLREVKREKQLRRRLQQEMENDKQESQS